MFLCIGASCRVCLHLKPWLGPADTFVVEILCKMCGEAVEDEVEATLFGAFFDKLIALFCI